jgi:hypothetical protein
MKAEPPKYEKGVLTTRPRRSVVYTRATLCHRMGWEWSHDSSVGIATGYWLEGWSYIPGRAKKLFLSPQHARLTLEPNQLPPQWVPGLFPQGLGGRDLHPSSAKVKNGGAIYPILHMSSRRGASLIKHKDNFTFQLYGLGMWL